jgi:hypothetical protein
MVVGTPVVATNGRISNLVDEPNEADEHPWGGDEEPSDGPQTVTTPFDDPIIVGGKYYFLEVTIKGTWLNIRQILWDVTVDRNPEIKQGTEATPIPTNNNNDQGARN